MTPEFFPRPPLRPESQRGRFWCVHMGVNDHQQSCRQPPQCFYNGILIRSPHHPAELKSAPVCLFLVRLLLPTGDRRQRLWPTYFWGPSHALGQTPSSGTPAVLQMPPSSLQPEKRRQHKVHLWNWQGSWPQPRDAAPQAREAAVSPEHGLWGPVEPDPQPHPSQSFLDPETPPPSTQTSGQKPERSLLSSFPQPPPVLSKSHGL